MNGVTIPSLSLSHSSLLWNRVIGLNREREREETVLPARRTFTTDSAYDPFRRS